VPSHDQLVRIDDIANPVEGPHIRPQAGIEPQCLINRQALRDHCEDGAILGGSQPHMIGSDDTAPAGHIDGHDSRPTGNMFAYMPSDQAGIGVIIPTDRRSNDELNLLAAIKIRDGIGNRRWSTQRQQDKNEGRNTPICHAFLPSFCWENATTAGSSVEG